MDFEIHPASVDIVMEVVLVKEIFRDVSEIYFDLFGIVERCC